MAERGEKPVRLVFTDFDNYILERLHGKVLRKNLPCMFSEHLSNMNRRNLSNPDDGFWEAMNVRSDDGEIHNWQIEFYADKPDSITKMDIWNDKQQGAVLLSEPISPLHAMLWSAVIISTETKGAGSAIRLSERVLDTYINPENLLPRESEALTYEEWRQGV